MCRVKPERAGLICVCVRRPLTHVHLDVNDECYAIFIYRFSLYGGEGMGWTKGRGEQRSTRISKVFAMRV